MITGPDMQNRLLQALEGGQELGTIAGNAQMILHIHVNPALFPGLSKITWVMPPSQDWTVLGLKQRLKDDLKQLRDVRTQDLGVVVNGRATEDSDKIRRLAGVGE